MLFSVDGGLSQWADWEECDAECGYGVQVRKRECNTPAPANGGRDCYGDTIERRRCRSRSCSKCLFFALATFFINLLTFQLVF